MNTELAVYTLQETMELGQVLAKSGFFADIREASQAVAKILAGRELGIPPIAAMSGIHIVKGKASIGANLMAGQVKRSGKYDYRVVELSDNRCELVFLQGSEQIGVSVFTKEDAKRAGTQNMDKFPRNMLFARALSNGVRWYCPDIFAGPVYTPEELNDAPTQIVIDPPIPPRLVAPAAPAVDTETGEIDPQPILTSGSIENLQSKFNRNGKLFLSFTVNEHKILFLAPDHVWLALENGDPVAIVGWPKHNDTLGDHLYASEVTIREMTIEETVAQLKAREDVPAVIDAPVEQQEVAA